MIYRFSLYINYSTNQHDNARQNEDPSWEKTGLASHSEVVTVWSRVPSIIRGEETRDEALIKEHQEERSLFLNPLLASSGCSDNV